MLGKLLKHEFRATSRIMLPIFLIVILTAFGANLSTRKLLEMNHLFLNTVGIVLMFAFVLAIIGTCFAAFLIMIQRFYKNLLQDEGYIMMTLPVSVHQLVSSKVLISTLWYAGTAIIVIIAMLILTFDIQFIQDFIDSWPQFVSSIQGLEEYAVHIPFITLEFLIIAFIGCAGTCLKFYSAMAIGHSFANHKMLFSVVTYFGTQFVLQLLTGLFFTIVNYTEIDYYLANHLPTFNGTSGIHIIMIIMIIFALIHAAVFYFITTYFLSKRLNLE